MNRSILLAKLQPPSIESNTWARHRLIATLNAGRYFTTMVAPAGSGKTTGVLDWLYQLSDTVDIRWLSLDQIDNDLSRFTNYLSHIFKFDNRCKTNDSKLAYRDNLLNHLGTIRDPMYIVFDNYHVIQTETIHDILRCLLNNPNPFVRLIILSRSSLPFNLATLRLRKQLTEVSTQDLYLNVEEIEAYFKYQDIQLTHSQLQAVARKTHGWIACLEMLILRLQTSTHIDGLVESFSGIDPYLTEFFYYEFYQSYPSGYQDFLNHTSVLKTLTADQCNAILEIDDSHHYFTWLKSVGAPIFNMDDNQTVFQYHPLYREFLLQQLQTEHSRDTKKIHQRAYRWYLSCPVQTENTIRNALEHASYVGQDMLLDGLEFLSPTIHQQGHNDLFLDYLNTVSSDILLAYPRLFLAYMWALYADGQFYKTNVMLEQGEHQLPDDYMSELYALRTQISVLDNNPEQSKTLALQTLAMLSPDDLVLCGLMNFSLGRLAFFYDGDTNQAIRQLSVAIELFEQASHHALWSIATDCLIAVRQRHGSLMDAEALCRYAINLCNKVQQPNLLGAFYSQLGKILYEYDNLQEAEKVLRQGRKHSRQFGGTNSFLASSLTLARLVGSVESQAVLDEARDFVSADGYQLARLSAFPVSRLAEHGWISPYIDWNKHSYDSEIDRPTSISLYTYLELARQLCHGNNSKPRRAITLLLELETLTTKMNQRGSLLEVLTLQAWCYESLGDTKSAQVAIERALLIAQHTGHKRAFLDFGKPLIQLLEIASNKRQFADYARQIIYPSEQKLSAATYRHDVVPLTKREKQILRLLGEGFSNPEISHYLDISVSTTRWHVKNIYRKLNVNNRTRATIRARELGII